jgi:hypothetical protein
VIALLLSASALAIPREDVLYTASTYAAHVWSMTSANTVASCDSGYRSDYSPGTYVGLPYDWGGYMTLAEYDAQIADGYGAGGHSDDGSLWCTAGVDCSGFVSMDWGAAHNSTSTLDTIASAISWDSIERADAVNDAGSHVVLFTHIGADAWPVFWEASGGADKVHINTTGGWSYLDGYQPMRYDHIEDGSSTGTAQSPRVISAFPYSDSWWTPGAASDVLDGYSCDPGADEGGPEVLYRATLPTGGTLTAVVSDGDDTDIDVHVLTAPDADACLGRDDTTVRVHVSAGDVWLSLDSYVGSHEDSGAYTLTVDFAPDEGGDTGTADSGGSDDSGGGATGDTDTGGTDGTSDSAAPTLIPQANRVDSEEGGCGCATGGLRGNLAGWLVVAGMAGAAGLRRRR